MNNNYLQHHGILGQKWGVRRYQNEDGSYTAKGRERHANNSDKITKLENKASKYGGHITKSGKYKASNGVTIAKSNNATVAGVRKFANKTLVGRALASAGVSQMAKMTGRSKESIKQEMKKEHEALNEYWKVGGDKMLKKYEKLSMNNISNDSLSAGQAAVKETLNSSNAITKSKVSNNTVKQSTKSNQSTNSKAYKKAYDKAETELYRKYGKELEKYAYGKTQDSKKYYDLVDKIESEARKTASSQTK